MCLVVPEPLLETVYGWLGQIAPSHSLWSLSPTCDMNGSIIVKLNAGVVNKLSRGNFSLGWPLSKRTTFASYLSFFYNSVSHRRDIPTCSEQQVLNPYPEKDHPHSKCRWRISTAGKILGFSSIRHS